MDPEAIFSIALGALLAAFSGAVVGYAFLRKRHGDSLTPDTGGGTVPGVPDNDDGPSLDSIFDAINTLELEHQLGNLPDDQFQEQFQAYRLQAAEMIRYRMESGTGDPAWVLEQEVMMARSGLQVGSQPGVACPDCGAPAVEAARECSQCGADLALAGPGLAARASGNQ